ncbi:MAG: porphobilinogen synthase [Pseudomonadota bacterium]|nr:porphobilinogen synthase [Pseudomonadota bacterium]MDE3038773.1 porphobilinogen synthase [Pseudomonadota bacterium]
MNSLSTKHQPPTTFPATRLRRPRMAAWSRELVAETRLHPSDLILPVFVQEGKNRESLVESMVDISRITIDVLEKKSKSASQLGIPAIAIFPVVDKKLKSPMGDEALNPKNLACRAIEAIKSAAPDIGVIADVALDPYTTHGQDGIVEKGQVVNDKTVEMLCEQALVLAKAGCDIVAPSDMMDGRIGAIRNSLEREKFHDTMILAYAAKYASGFYGPFRDAVGSGLALGKADKKAYQMDVRNSREAMREIALDISEGADMVMVKPALPCLDIIHMASQRFDLPIFAYQVSGEYAMLKAAAKHGWINGDAVMLESLTAMKRAGARAIFTYAAMEIARQLHD